MGQSYIDDSYRSSRQECINLFPKMVESGEKRESEVMALIGVPGYKLVHRFDQPIRKLYSANNGDLFIFAGERVFRTRDLKFFADINVAHRLPFEGRIDVADNGDTMVIAVGKNVYTHKLNSERIEPLVDDKKKPVVIDDAGVESLQYLNQKFYYVPPGKQIIYQSSAGEVAAIHEFSQAESSPDPIVATAVLSGDFWAFGERSLEILSDEGQNLVRTSQGRYEIGLVAPESVEKIGEIIIWLGKDESGGARVYMSIGGKPQKISTDFIDRKLQSYSSVSQATSWGYQLDGQTFYCLNVPGANTTWVYSLSTQLWHERRFKEDERDRPELHAYALEKHLVADYQDGRLYELSPDSGDHDGQQIVRVRTTPHVTNALKRVKHKEIQIDAEVGQNSTLTDKQQEFDPFGVLTADDAPGGLLINPHEREVLLAFPIPIQDKFLATSKIKVEWSDDGGFNWSKGRIEDMGRAGETRKRIIFRRLGMARDRIYRCKIYSRGRVVILGAELMAA